MAVTGNNFLAQRCVSISCISFPISSYRDAEPGKKSNGPVNTNSCSSFFILPMKQTGPCPCVWTLDIAISCFYLYPSIYRERVHPIWIDGSTGNRNYFVCKWTTWNFYWKCGTVKPLIYSEIFQLQVDIYGAIKTLLWTELNSVSL